MISQAVVPQMIKKLFNWLEINIKASDSNIAGASSSLEALSVPLATSVLYFEIIRADDTLDASELAAYEKLVLQEFEALHDNLQKELEPLLKKVEARARESVDFMQFTRLIHENCSHADKLRILTSLWHLAGVDGVIDPHEEHLIRRMADLMYMDHKDFIKTKLQALEDLKL